MARTVMVFGRYCAQFPFSQEFAACLGSQPQWPLTTACRSGGTQLVPRALEMGMVLGAVKGVD